MLNNITTNSSLISYDSKITPSKTKNNNVSKNLSFLTQPIYSNNTENKILVSYSHIFHTITKAKSMPNLRQGIQSSQNNINNAESNSYNYFFRLLGCSCNKQELIINNNIINNQKVSRFFSELNNFKLIIKDKDKDKDINLISYAKFLDNLPDEISLKSFNDKQLTSFFSLATSSIGQEIIQNYPKKIMDCQYRLDMLSDLCANSYSYKFTLDNIEKIHRNTIYSYYYFKDIDSQIKYDFCTKNIIKFTSQPIIQGHNPHPHPQLKIILTHCKTSADFNFIQQYLNDLDNISIPIFNFGLKAYTTGNSQQKTEIEKHILANTLTKDELIQIKYHTFQDRAFINSNKELLYSLPEENLFLILDAYDNVSNKEQIHQFLQLDRNFFISEIKDFTLFLQQALSIYSTIDTQQLFINKYLDIFNNITDEMIVKIVLRNLSENNPHKNQFIESLFDLSLPNNILNFYYREHSNILSNFKTQDDCEFITKFMQKLNLNLIAILSKYYPENLVYPAQNIEKEAKRYIEEVLETHIAKQPTFFDFADNKILYILESLKTENTYLSIDKNSLSLLKTQNYESTIFEVALKGLTSNDAYIVEETIQAINNENFVTNQTLHRLINVPSNGILNLNFEDLTNQQLDFSILFKRCPIITFSSYYKMETNNIRDLINILQSNNIKNPPTIRLPYPEVSEPVRFYNFYKNMLKSGEIISSFEQVEHAFQHEQLTLDIGELLKLNNDKKNITLSQEFKQLIDNTHISKLAITNNESRINFTPILEYIASSVKNKKYSIEVVDLRGVNMDFLGISYKTFSQFLTNACSNIKIINFNARSQIIYSAVFNFLATIKPPNLISVEDIYDAQYASIGEDDGFFISLYPLYPQIAIERFKNYYDTDEEIGKTKAQEFLQTKHKASLIGKKEEYLLRGHKNIYLTHLNLDTLTVDEIKEIIINHNTDLKNIYLDSLTTSNGLQKLISAFNMVNQNPQTKLRGLPELNINDFDEENTVKKQEIQKLKDTYNKFFKPTNIQLARDFYKW